MAEKPNNPPAFPSVALNDPGHPASISGMSLRDYFAAQALASMNDILVIGTAEDIAENCYKIADAFMAERAEGEAS